MDWAERTSKKSFGSRREHSGKKSTSTKSGHINVANALANFFAANRLENCLKVGVGFRTGKLAGATQLLNAQMVVRSQVLNTHDGNVIRVRRVLKKTPHSRALFCTGNRLVRAQNNRSYS